MKKLYVGVGIALVLLILLKLGLSARSSGTDQQQIEQALDDSIQASKEGKPGSVMDLIGNQITFNSSDASGQMGDLRKFIKSQHPDIVVKDKEPKINGDSAQISSPVDMTVSFFGQSKTVHFPQVILIFQKEPSTQWLVIPSSRWKLEQVQVPNFTPDQLSQ